MKISRKFLSLLFIVTTIVTFIMLYFSANGTTQDINYIASPSMGLGVILSYHFLQNKISVSSNRLKNLLSLLTIFLVSHLIAGTICGVFAFLIYYTDYYTFYNFVGVIFSMMWFSLIVSPATIFIVIISAIILNKKSRRSDVSSV
jgi:hypothetical protein